MRRSRRRFTGTARPRRGCSCPSPAGKTWAAPPPDSSWRSARHESGLGRGRGCLRRRPARSLSEPTPAPGRASPRWRTPCALGPTKARSGGSFAAPGPGSACWARSSCGRISPGGPTFRLDPGGLLPGDTCFALPSADPWLIAALQHPLTWWWLWHRAQRGKDEVLRLKRALMRRLPIPKPHPEGAEAAWGLNEQERRLVARTAPPTRRALDGRLG
jgi:hypothetical protein